MLIDIFRMPPVLGIPTDRRVDIHCGDQPPSDLGRRILHWKSAPFYHDDIVVGSLIDRAPENVYKAVYVSQDSKWVFETVFAMESKSCCICLYTKLISPIDVNVGISLNAIQSYQNDRPQLLPISHFIRAGDANHIEHYETALTTSVNILDSIVPPIFGDRNLGTYLDHLLEDRHRGQIGSTLNRIYEPIYDHEPSVFRAMIEGQFERSPFTQIIASHPSVNIQKDRFYNYEELHYMITSRGFSSQINYEPFDSLALAIIQLPPTKLSVSALMSHAVDEIKDVWLIREFSDSYQGLLRGMYFDEAYYKQTIATILHHCVIVYCQLYSIDHRVYLEKVGDQSCVTISKNIYDEVAITFHDFIEDRCVCFYSSFTSLALSTLSVGWYT